MACCPSVAWATESESWTIATQIAAGTRVADPTILALATKTLEAEVGQVTVEKLLTAILERDADSITKPFEDKATEAAARRFVEIVYTGQFSSNDMAGFHQALAWQVLPFTKPPSVCGPGFGWWTQSPKQS